MRQHTTLSIITAAAAGAFLLLTASCSSGSSRIDGKANALDMVRAEMTRCPDGTYLDGMEGRLKWNYTTGLELMSFLEVWEAYGEAPGYQDIFDYVQDWYERAVDTAGVIYKYKKSNFNTDHVCPGNALFVLYDRTGDARWMTAMQTLRDQLKDHPRTSEGGFWHKGLLAQADLPPSDVARRPVHGPALLRPLCGHLRCP